MIDLIRLVVLINMKFLRHFRGTLCIAVSSGYLKKDILDFHSIIQSICKRYEILLNFLRTVLSLHQNLISCTQHVEERTHGKHASVTHLEYHVKLLIFKK
ncbi:hypothetical protein O6H91_Y290500 [Diphasiastrum complanatum]|nr:hypothetical protein O6H91_Y290500 [Diphasiastrum complanatum]